MRWFDNFDVHGLGRNCNVQTLFMRVVPRQFFQAVLLTQSFSFYWVLRLQESSAAPLHRSVCVAGKHRLCGDVMFCFHEVQTRHLMSRPTRPSKRKAHPFSVCVCVCASCFGEVTKRFPWTAGHTLAVALPQCIVRAQWW